MQAYDAPMTYECGLIDGDIVLYKYSCSNEATLDFGTGSLCVSTDLEQAKTDVKRFIEFLQDYLGTTNTIICLSGANNFRYGVLPTYKHNRSGKEKPRLYTDLKKWVMDNYECKVKDTLEADDVMSIMSTKEKGKHIICTIDKDLNQVPGYHFNWNQEAFYTVSEEEGNYFFYLQCLVGDPTDGYKGCPKIGYKKGAKILEGCKTPEEYWTQVVKTYEEVGLTEEDALVQARVARMLRVDDYDYKKKEVKLWTPPSILKGNDE